LKTDTDSISTVTKYTSLFIHSPLLTATIQTKEPRVKRSAAGGNN